MDITETPRIYVACLASYNSGILYGAWIDADQEPDAIMEEVSAMLKASPEEGAEEWAIHDYDNFEGIEARTGRRPGCRPIHLNESDIGSPMWLST